METKKIIAIVLAVAGILLTGAAETRADSFVVKQGFYETAATFQQAKFSGDNFAVDYSIGGGIFLGDARVMFFETGTLVAGFGRWTPPPSVPDVFFGPGDGTIQVGDVSCQPANDAGQPDCGGFLTFTNSPMGLPPPDKFFAAEAPFTMTGQLILSQMGFPNMIVDVKGTGIVHVTLDPNVESGELVRYEFATVPEPSTVVLVMSGLVAAGWSRWRGGKRSVSRG
jgi:PEP-CTERM motif